MTYIQKDAKNKSKQIKPTDKFNTMLRGIAISSLITLGLSNNIQLTAQAAPAALKTQSVTSKSSEKKTINLIYSIYGMDFIKYTSSKLYSNIVGSKEDPFVITKNNGNWQGEGYYLFSDKNYETFKEVKTKKELNMCHMALYKTGIIGLKKPKLPNNIPLLSKIDYKGEVFTDLKNYLSEHKLSDNYVGKGTKDSPYYIKSFSKPLSYYKDLFKIPKICLIKGFETPLVSSVDDFYKYFFIISQKLPNIMGGNLNGSDSETVIVDGKRVSLNSLGSTDEQLIKAQVQFELNFARQQHFLKNTNPAAYKNMINSIKTPKRFTYQYMESHPYRNGDVISPEHPLFIYYDNLFYQVFNSGVRLINGVPFKKADHGFVYLNSQNHLCNVNLLPMPYYFGWFGNMLYGFPSQGLSTFSNVGRSALLESMIALHIKPNLKLYTVLPANNYTTYGPTNRIFKSGIYTFREFNMPNGGDRQYGSLYDPLIIKNNGRFIQAPYYLFKRGSKYYENVRRNGPFINFVQNLNSYFRALTRRNLPKSYLRNSR